MRSKSVLEASWERFWEDFGPMLDTKSVQKGIRNTAGILNDFGGPNMGQDPAGEAPLIGPDRRGGVGEGFVTITRELY